MRFSQALSLANMIENCNHFRDKALDSAPKLGATCDAFGDHVLSLLDLEEYASS
jgi:hypothetical protein